MCCLKIKQNVKWLATEITVGVIKKFTFLRYNLIHTKLSTISSQTPTTDQNPTIINFDSEPHNEHTTIGDYRTQE